MRKERKRLDFADRKRIEAMKNSGVKVTEIAQAVGVHRATIYHELKRGESLTGQRWHREHYKPRRQQDGKRGTRHGEEHGLDL